MNILTVGDSWTEGTESSNPKEMSWPAQLAKKYNVCVTNLGYGGSSNKRNMRIAVEEISKNPVYDMVILGLCPASRTEVLKKGKWFQVWPTEYHGEETIDRLFAENWHPWGDLQNTIMECFYFFNTMKNLGVDLYVTGLGLFPDQFSEELSWIVNYKNDNDFNSLGMPLDELNIGIKDLDRKLVVLKKIHEKNLQMQPDYLYDVPNRYLKDCNTKAKYGQSLFASGGHPNDQGYLALADYFASKIKLY